MSKPIPRSEITSRSTSSNVLPSANAGEAGSGNVPFRRRLLAYAVYSPALLLLVLWVWIFVQEGAFKGGPGGKAFGADFAMFITAGKVLKEGGNPYDHALLYRTERAMMREQHLQMTHKSQVVRVGNPPLFFWLLEPESSARFQVAGYVWIAGLYLLSLAGLLAALLYTGWRARLVPSLMFLLMPQVLLGAFYGNVIGVVFAGVAAALLVIDRYPTVAGALLVVAWLKPQVAIPIVLLLLLFHSAVPRRVFTGFAAASTGAGILMLVTCGWKTVGWWAGGLLGYSRDIGILPDVASLAGLYSGWAPQPIRIALGALTLSLALGLTLETWRSRRWAEHQPLIATGWLWFVWLLATPYAHFSDLIFLTVPVAALLGPHGRGALSLPGASMFYLLLLSLFFINPTAHDIYLLPIPTLLAGVLAYRMREGGRNALGSPVAAR